MTEHISVDDMMELVFAERLDDRVLAASAKIDAHMAQCDECWETYQQLLAAKDAFDQIGCYAPKGERIAQKVLEGLMELQHRQAAMAARISDRVSVLTNLKTAVKLKVDGVYSLIGEQLAGGSEYYNPTLAVATKSTGPKDGEPKAVPSTLVDENQNRITISLDGTLTAFFNLDECPEDTLVILIPTQEDAKPCFECAARYDARTVVARFHDVEPGEYIIAFSE